VLWRIFGFEGEEVKEAEENIIMKSLKMHTDYRITLD
jgi:hypothetical protein